MTTTVTVHLGMKDGKARFGKREAVQDPETGSLYVLRGQVWWKLSNPSNDGTIGWRSFNVGFPCPVFPELDARLRKAMES